MGIWHGNSEIFSNLVHPSLNSARSAWLPAGMIITYSQFSVDLSICAL